jgi:predicted Rossmann fold flavoprotein
LSVTTSGPRRVAVVGAGAAGLTAAIRAAEAGARVILLNAHPKVGLKILMSGGTRCNVTHREVTERDYHGGSRPFVARVLRAFTPEQSREWLESLGVGLKLEETGKYFPVSDDAQTVLDALLGEAERRGVELRNGARVVRLERGFRLGIQRVTDSAAFAPVAAVGRADWPLIEVEPDEWLEAGAVVLASGGLSFPRTGSDGAGYSLVQSLGHKIVPTIPALTPLAANDPWCSTLQGVTVDVQLSLSTGGRRSEVVRGSFLFAHFGYSGPAALDLSRHWLRAAASESPRVTASFLPGVTAEALASDWVEVGRTRPRLTVRRWLGDRLPDRLVMALCDEAEVDSGKLASQVSRKGRSALIGRVLERDLPVTGTLGYEKAEVTAGGVALDQVNPSTLESRIVPGLFLCGEILDVEGRLGGFNFQFAWSSGTVAGRAAAGTDEGL